MRKLKGAASVIMLSRSATPTSAAGGGSVASGGSKKPSAGATDGSLERETLGAVKIALEAVPFHPELLLDKKKPASTGRYALAFSTWSTRLAAREAGAPIHASQKRRAIFQNPADVPVTAALAVAPNVSHVFSIASVKCGSRVTKGNAGGGDLTLLPRQSMVRRLRRRVRVLSSFFVFGFGGGGGIDWAVAVVAAAAARQRQSGRAEAP